MFLFLGVRQEKIGGTLFKVVPSVCLQVVEFLGIGDGVLARRVLRLRRLLQRLDGGNRKIVRRVAAERVADGDDKIAAVGDRVDKGP